MKRWLCAGSVLSVVLLLTAAPATPQSWSNSSASTAWCKGGVSWSLARRNIGEPVRIRARVIRTYYAATTTGRPTFIDLGHAYPSQNRLTILIWGRNRVNFPRPPERMFRPGAVVCAQGIVEMYHGVPEVEVALYDSRQRLLSF